MEVTPNLEIGGAQENRAHAGRSTCRNVAARRSCARSQDGPLAAEIERARGARRDPPGRDATASSRCRRSSSRWCGAAGTLVATHRQHGVDIVQTQGLGTLDFLVMTLQGSATGPGLVDDPERRVHGPRGAPATASVAAAAPSACAHRLLYRAGRADRERGDRRLRRHRCDPSAIPSVTSTARSRSCCNAVDVERYPASIDDRAKARARARVSARAST